VLINLLKPEFYI